MSCFFFLNFSWFLFLSFFHGESDADVSFSFSFSFFLFAIALSYDERVLPSIGNEVLKATVAQFDAAELITQREIVSARIRADLLQRAKEFNIVLEDVSITHMTFGKEFTTAVEQKQIAQQDAERAKFVVEKAEQERQAAVIRAEGEAEAAATIGKALDKAGEAFVQFRRIEASKDIGESTAKKKPQEPLRHVTQHSKNIFFASDDSIRSCIC